MKCGQVWTQKKKNEIKKKQQGVTGSWSFPQFNLRWSRAPPCLFLEGLKNTEGMKNKTSFSVCQAKVNRRLWLKRGYNRCGDNKNEEKWQSLGGRGGPLSFSWLLRQSALGLMSAGSPTLNTRREAARNPWRQAAVPRQPSGGGKSQISPLKAVLNLSPLVCLDPCNQLEIVTLVTDTWMLEASLPRQKKKIPTLTWRQWSSTAANTC